MDCTVDTVDWTKETAVLTVSDTKFATLEMVLDTKLTTSPTLLMSEAASAVFSTTADTTLATLETT